MVEKQCQLGPDGQAAVGSKQTLLGNRNTFMRFFSVDRPFVEPGQTQIDPSISPFRGRFLLSGTRLALAALAVAFVIQPDQSPASAEESTSAAQVLAAQVYDLSVPPYPQCVNNVHIVGNRRQVVERFVNTYLKVYMPDNLSAAAAAKDPKASINIKNTADASSSGFMHFVPTKEENEVREKAESLLKKTSGYALATDIINEILERKFAEIGYQSQTKTQKTLGVVYYADEATYDQIGAYASGGVFVYPGRNVSDAKTSSKDSVYEDGHEKYHAKVKHYRHSSNPKSFMFWANTLGDPELKILAPDDIDDVCGGSIWTVSLPAIQR